MQCLNIWVILRFSVLLAGGIFCPWVVDLIRYLLPALVIWYDEAMLIPPVLYHVRSEARSGDHCYLHQRIGKHHTVHSETCFDECLQVNHSSRKEDYRPEYLNAQRSGTGLLYYKQGGFVERARLLRAERSFVGYKNIGKFLPKIHWRHALLFWTGTKFCSEKILDIFHYLLI